MKLVKILKKRKGGFTFVETIAALIVVVLISVVLVTGITSSIKVYDRSVFISESETLVSTIDNELCDLLRYSNFEYVDADGVVRFSNSSYGIDKGKLLVEDGRIKIASSKDMTDPKDYTNLLQNGVYSTLEVKNLKIDYKDGIFSGTYEIESSKVNVTPKKVSFTARSLKS